MEILIIVAIWSVVVKRGVEDILHTARGGTPHRYAAAKARRESGAAGRYWSTLWGDTFDDMLAKHTERRARRQASPSTPRPRGAASQFFAGLFQDGRRAARRKWEGGWTVLDEKRREKATRPRPGQVTVPGTVVPNAQDGGRPQDGDGDRPDPQPVPDEDGDEDGTDLQDEPPAMQDEDEQDEQPVPDSGPDSGPDQDTSPTAWPTTQEGPTIMTATAVDGIGLDPQIKFCEESEQQYLANAQSNDNDLATSKQFAKAYRQQVTVTESALGAVPQGVALEAVAAMTQAMDKATAAAAVMDQIAALYAQAMDKANAAAADMATAAKEFVSYKNLQEGYAAQPDAPDKGFLLAGR